MTLGGQFLGQFHPRLSRPPQPRHRITPGLRIDQPVQRRPPPRIGRLHRLAPYTLGPHPPISQDPRIQLRSTTPDRVHRDTRVRRDQLDPTPPEHTRSRPQQQPTHPLLQHRSHLSHHPRERLREPRDLRHSTTLEIMNPKADVIYP